MTREDFKIVPKFYKTSSLTMIFYHEVIIESVEIYKNYKTWEDETSKAERLAEIKKQVDAGKKKIKVTKPRNMKTSKDKRSEEEINNECESLIKKYIKKHSGGEPHPFLIDEIGQFPGHKPKF